MSEEIKNEVVATSEAAPATTAVVEEKKPRKKPSKTKPTKAKLAVPDGGFQSAEVPDFDVRIHAKLKEGDFADVLDFARWNVTYCEKVLEKAKQEVERIQSLGATPEERKAAQSQEKILRAMEALVAQSKAAKGGKASSALASRLGALFAEMQGG